MLTRQRCQTSLLLASLLSLAIVVNSTPINPVEFQQKSKEMFYSAFNPYKKFALGADAISPNACTRTLPDGDIAASLFHSLDSLIIFNDKPAFDEAIDYIISHQDTIFDKDVVVDVMSTTHNVLSPILSAHQMLKQHSSSSSSSSAKDKGRADKMLKLAVDLADRLMFAFNTPTKLPLESVNLRSTGITPNADDYDITCTACAGSLLTEMPLLSSLTGNTTYQETALYATQHIYDNRSDMNLLGSSLSVTNGTWVDTTATVGDSSAAYYESLFSTYLLTGNPHYLAMFATLSSAASQELLINIGDLQWMADLDSNTGALVSSNIQASTASWPGLLALLGLKNQSNALLRHYVKSWHIFGWLPEQYDLELENIPPSHDKYQLKGTLPLSTLRVSSLENSTSTTTKHINNADSYEGFLEVGAEILTRVNLTKLQCGYGSVVSVSQGTLEDYQPPYILSQTAKWLYVLFSKAGSALSNSVVVSPGGHVMLPLPTSSSNDDMMMMMGSKEGGTVTDGHIGVCSIVINDPTRTATYHKSNCNDDTSTSSSSISSEAEVKMSPVDEMVALQCQPLCTAIDANKEEDGVILKNACPLLANILNRQPTIDDSIVRGRRCIACQVVVRATLVENELVGVATS